MKFIEGRSNGVGSGRGHNHGGDDWLGEYAEATPPNPKSHGTDKANLVGA